MSYVMEEVLPYRHKHAWKKNPILFLSCFLLSGCAILEHESQSQSWEQCRTSARTLLKKRKKAEALALANASVAAAQSFGDSDFRYGVALCVQADVLYANEKNSEAKAAYKRSIKVLNRAEKIAEESLEKGRDPKPSINPTAAEKAQLDKREEQKVQLRLVREDIANSFEHLGHVYVAEGKEGDAAKSYLKAAEKYQQVFDSDIATRKSPELIVHQQLVRCLLSLAQAAAANKDTSLADDSFKRAIAQAATSYCNETDRKDVRNEYLKYLQETGRPQEAPGLVSDVMFDQLTADGTLSLYEGDYTAAELAYRKALDEGARSVYTEQRILKALFNLVTVFTRAGKPDEVMRCSQLADDFMKQHKNASRKDYDQIQEVLANYYLISGNPKLCKQALLRQLQYRTVKFGRYSREVCTVYGLLGQAELQDNNNRAAATTYGNEGLAIINSQALDRSYFDAIFKVASLMMGLDRYKEARALYDKMVEIKSKKHEAGDVWLISLKVSVIVLEQKFHHKEQAEVVIKDIIKSVNESTPEQRAACFPYIALVLALCVHEQWWEMADQVAQMGQSIFHKDMLNTFPTGTVQESWTRDMGATEKHLNKKYS